MFDISQVKTPPLRPYQVDGVSFLESRTFAALFDDCGLGKTPQSLVAAKNIGAKKILIVCPAVARYNWEREILRWVDPAASVEVITKKVTTGQVSNCDWLVISHDLLTDLPTHKALWNRDWDLLIVDEAHFLKSKGAKRTKAVYGARCDLKGKSLAGKASRTWILTGTPAPNHTGELWTHLRALYPEAIPGVAGTPMGEIEFQSNYCALEETNWGTRVVGSKDMEKLRSKMDGFFLRRLKQNVLKDLPRVTIDTIPVSLAKMDGEDMNTSLSAHSDAQHLADAAKNMSGENLIKYMKDHAPELATYRRHTGLLKLPVCLEWLKTEMAGNPNKFIVFAIHHEVIDKIVEHMAAFNPVKLDGRDSAKTRDVSAQKFMDDPDCKLFVGQIAAAGTALTLTASKDVAFFEADWVPANNYQALSRAHRFTQTRGVVVRFLTLPNSIDDIISRALVRKTRELNQLFG
jgi:SWI/SNF-related matrix-associated actin-dependent regulator 1 of chromatin subfamily A